MFISGLSMSEYKRVKNYEMFLEFSKDKTNKEQRNEIFKKYEYIAEIISKKYVNKGIDYDDLFQIACIGLLYAIERYDLGRGFEFSSFATPTVLGEIKKYFRDKSWTLKMPRRIQELSKKISDAKMHLTQTMQKTPAIKDIAEYLESTEEEILEAMEASKTFTPKSLDMKYENGNEEKDISLLDIIGKEDFHFKNFEDKEFISNVMENLNTLERAIVEERYINNEKTQMELSKKFNISQVTVSRIEKKVLKKFKIEYDKISK
jgi:RNA polymerase sigma-B factor